MLSVEIPCSRDKMTLQLPATATQKTRLVQTRKASAATLSSADIAKSLEQPLGCAPLRELARGKQSACVVISDITRPVPNPLLLPPLLSSLEQAGIPRDAITILIATGMHRPNLGSELEELVGGEIAANYRIINHDCHARDNLRQVAVIDGAPIEVNRHYLDAEFKILTGLIEPHPFAGFSGGGKSILPGLASFETMKFMHSFALVDHPDVATARIADNPFRHHINTVSAAAGVDFIANVLIDDAKQPVAIFSGDPQTAFTAGCRQAESNAVVHVGTPADLVITSGGGYPLDATLYQSSKGLIAAGNIVRPGGTILMIAGCSEGLGSRSYCDIIRSANASPEQFRTHYSHPDNFVIDQWGAQVYFQTLERCGRILLYSPHLTQQDIDPFGMTLVTDPAAVLPELCAQSQNIYIVPEGPYVGCVL